MLDILTVPKSIQSIILDKDGTIIDAHHYWIEMSNLRIREVLNSLNISESTKKYLKNKLEKSFGIDNQNQRISKHGPASVKPRNYMAKLMLDGLLEEEIIIKHEEINEAFLRVDEISEGTISNFLTLLPGVENFINESFSRGIDLCLVTNDITPRANLALKHLGLFNKFKYIFGQDKVSEPKPAKDLAELVVKSGNYSKECIINIGDHPNDMKMGINAEINQNYAVLTGLSDKDNFLGVNCNCFIDFTKIEFDD